MTRSRRSAGAACARALAVAVLLAATSGAPSARAEAVDAAEAARVVIDSGPYQKTFPGASGARERKPRRTGGGAPPAWRQPELAIPSKATTDAATGAVTAVLVVVGSMVALGLALLAWARLQRWRRRKPPAIVGDDVAAMPGQLRAHEPDAIIAAARKLLADGKGSDAVLLLWRDGVNTLLRAKMTRLHGDDALTGREIVRAVGALDSTVPSQLAGLKTLLTAMERAWFGHIAVTEAQLAHCEDAWRAVVSPPVAVVTP